MNNQVTVAVIDTGLSPECLDNPVILPGMNLSGEGEVEDTSDSGTHGTAVAKTILSIAPETRLVPIRLMNHRGSLRDRKKVEEAFEWILKNREALGINIVCAAFADFSHSTSDAEHRGSRLQQQIATLREMNVATIAPAGNWYPEFRHKSAQGMAWPAIIREVISVGEVEKHENGFRLTHRTQRLYPNLGTGCWTTVFAESSELGETSGAAAMITGFLTKLKQTSSHANEPLFISLPKLSQVAYDENISNWVVVNKNILTVQN